MKVARIALLLLLIAAAALFCLFFSQPYQRHIALLSSLDIFWGAVCLLIALLCAGTLFLLRTVRSRKAGKKGILPGIVAGLLYLVSLACLIFVVPLFRYWHLQKTPYTSPDGTHTLYCRDYYDLFGQGTTVYGMYGKRYYYDLFDTGKGEDPKIEWTDHGVKYYYGEFPYPD